MFEDRILVHICCSVDSHHFLTQLREIYPAATLIGFFYNPNIHPFEEYRLRFLDVQRSCQMLDIELLDDEYDVANWLRETQGYEQAPEKGERCGICFDVRLHKTAKKAKELHIPYISTTLLTSPMKPQNELFALGEQVAASYGLGFISLDTRSKGGTQKQQALAKEAKLYRQNYCGCLYALEVQRQKSAKKAYELVCSLPYKRYLEHPINQRIRVYEKRIELESSNSPYHLYKRRQLVYYPFFTRLENSERKLILSYPLIYSLFPYGSGGRMQKVKVELVSDGVGYCDRSEVFLVSIEKFCQLLDKKMTLSQLISDPCCIEEENKIRHFVEGSLMATSLILVVESFVQGDIFYVSHEATYQEEIMEEILEVC